MPNDERRSSGSAWAALAGLTPLYIFSSELSVGLVLGIGFLVVHSTAAATSLLLPARFGRPRVFALAAVGAAVAASLSASVVRLIDPFLFEATHRYLFLTVLTLPVLSACVQPDGMAERERGIENVVRGLGYALSVILLGAIREFLASGTISVNPAAGSSALLPIMAQPAGAFILLGLVAAGFRAVMKAAKGSER